LGEWQIGMQFSDRFQASLTDEGRYRLLVEAVTDYAIYMLDPSGIVSSWNPGAQRFKGYTPSEIIGQHFSRFYTEEDQATGKPARALATAVREGKFEDIGWRVRKDGTHFWAHVVIDPIRDASGDLVGFAKITRDLTERQKSEEARRRSEEQFRLLVQSVTDYSLYMLDLDGHVTSWNPGAQRIKGYAPEEILGQHFSRFYTEEDRANGEPAKALATALAEGRFEKEGWRVRKDGTRFRANVVIDPIRDYDGQVIGFAKITKDVTETRLAQEELTAAREALAQSQKMEAVGQLTGGIAHDFNNLLAGITGSLELIQSRLAQGRVADIEKFTIAALSAAKRAAALTHRLLAFSRRQTLDPKPTDVNRLVAGMGDLINRTMGPEIAVETVAGIGLWTTLVDANQLENALLNLSINARDAMPNGGRLVIETGNKWIDDRVGKLRDVAPGQYVTLSVSDNGVGMPPEIVERAFDPFFTTKPMGAGTGLGLSMIYGFAKQSEGQVRIYSEVGQGTRVCLYLPRYFGGGEDAEALEPAAALPRAQGKQTVLVIDDEPTVRMLIAEVLDELGYDSLEAENSIEGLKILRSKAAIDLMITDVGLPGGMNGRQLADAGKALRPGLKVLFITGYAENAVISQGHLAPDMHILTKPFTIDHLANRVSTILKTM
jgi:PAS domain S-box-containing protein